MTTDLPDQKPGPILGAFRWPTNAELIADAFRLHVPDRARIRVCDVTYGLGVWWRLVGEPDVRHGLRGDSADHYDDGVDFRRLPEPAGTFDLVAYDPPYVAPGGRSTSTIKDFHARYGLGTTPPRPDLLQELINDGLTEAHRVLRRGGLLLVKCQDYIWGGEYWPGAFLTLRQAAELDMSLVDRFEHLGDVRAQPSLTPKGKPRVQQHARRNHSTLYVLQRTRPIANQLTLEEQS